MGGEREIGRSLVGRRWLALLLCLVLLIAGSLASAVSPPVQSQDYQTWAAASTLAPVPCQTDGGNAGHVCCGAVAGCASMAFPDLAAAPAGVSRPCLVNGPSQAPPAGHSVAPLYHPPKLFSLT